MLVPTTLIKKWQRFAETFQKVTEPEEMAGCFRLASSSTSKNSGDSKNCQGSDKTFMQKSSMKSNGGTHPPQKELQSL